MDIGTSRPWAVFLRMDSASLTCRETSWNGSGTITKGITTRILLWRIPKGPTVGSSRVNKGGNWLSSPADDRCAFRGFSGESMSFWNLGFRVVLEEEKTFTASRDPEPDDPDAVPTGNADLPPSEEQGLRMFRQAVFAAQQERWDDAVKDLEEALKVYEQREDYQWIARVKATLAGIYAERNRIYKSKELYTQALAGFRKIGDAGSARILLARLRELETSPGVKVVEVKKGGIADKAGVVTGDIIIEYGGETGFRVSGFKTTRERVHAFGKGNPECGQQ